MTQDDPVAVPLSLSKRMEDLEVLSKNPLLAKLGLRDLGTLLDLLDQVALPRGTSIYREGDEADILYFVLEGQVALRRAQLDLRPAGPGDHFGELALAGVAKRTRSAEALTTVRLARMSRARYHALALQHPRIALSFMQALASALGDALTSMTDRVGLLLQQRSLPRRTTVRVRRDGVVAEVPTGTAVRLLLPEQVDGAHVVAATLDQKPVSLETPIASDVALEPLTTASPEGREVFRRSVGLVFLEAARRALPGAVVRLGASLGSGQIVHLEGVAPSFDLAESLGRTMRDIVRARTPLREEIWGLEEARSHFFDRGWDDAAALLPFRRGSAVTLLTCGATVALAMGPVLPNAGDLDAMMGRAPSAPFSIAVHPEGLLLDLGEPFRRYLPSHHGTLIDPIPTERRAPRYDSEMSREQRAWLAALGVTSVGRFNEACVTGEVGELIRVAEGFHEKRIGGIADAIAAEPDRVRIVAIAGPSSSGKSTFIERLRVQLQVDGRRPIGLSLDDYYVDRDKTVRDERGEHDFEALEALDLDLLQTHVERLLRGERVKTARYDFLTGKSHPEGGRELALRPGDVLLLEGIHGLNPRLLGDLRAQAYGVFVHPATTLPFDRLSVLAPEDLRLLRRIVRDRHQRGATAARSIARWPSVQRGEAVHIFPYRPDADAVFDSSLVYEPSVLKVYAERYLLEVPRDDPAFTTAYRLRELVDQFVAIHPDHVPPTSLVREFIGASGFSR